MRCAVFASGNGSNFQALIDRKDAGDLHVDFVVLVTNNSKAFACERARRRGIPVAFLAPSRFTDEESYTQELLSLLDFYGVELIVCAGYLKRIPAGVVARFRHRILNIHPSLLPSFGGQGFYGERVHEAVIEYGVKVTGVTVHLVDEDYDHGPIVLQRPLEVRDNDDAHSLARRLLELEHDSYWRAVEDIVQGKVRIVGRRVLRND